jgi:hypothetical protein
VATGSLARRAGIVLTVALVALLAGSAAYTWVTMQYEYSNGERAGVLQKLSRKGWVCKSYEGELALYVVAGVQPEVWYFTVRDPAIAQQLAKVVGQRVQLHYVEHRGIPTSCVGDTSYFVDRINETSAAPLGIGPVVR